MDNNKKNTAELQPWNSSSGLGFQILQRKEKILKRLNSELVSNRLNRIDRVSLGAEIYQRYHQRNPSIIRRNDFPLANFFLQPLRRSYGGDNNFSFQDPDMDTHHASSMTIYQKPFTGGVLGVEGISAPHSVVDSVMDKNPVIAQSTVLNRMFHMGHRQEYVPRQAMVQRKIGIIDAKSSNHPFLSRHSDNADMQLRSSLIHRMVEEQNKKEFALNPVVETTVTRIVPSGHSSVAGASSTLESATGVSLIDSGTESLADAQGQRLTLSGTIGNPLQSPIQRAVDRQSNGLTQKHQESNTNRIVSAGLIGDAFDVNATIDPASPPVATNRLVASLSSSRRDGLGLRRRLAAYNTESLSRGGSAGDFMPASIKRKYTPLRHSSVAGASSTLESAIGISLIDNGFTQKHQESNTNRIVSAGLIGDAFDVNATIDPASPPVATNRLVASLSSSRRDGLGLRRRLAAYNTESLSRGGSAGDFMPASIKRKYTPLRHSSVAGASSTLESATGISLIDNGFTQKHQESNTNRIVSAGLIGDAFDVNATIDPASPPVATNRSVASLSSSRRDGLGLRRRLAAHNTESLSRGGSAGDFMPASIKRKYTPLRHSSVAGASSTLESATGVSLIDSGTESLADAQGQRLTLSGTIGNPLQSPIQRAVDRQSNGLTQKHQESNTNRIVSAGLIGDAFDVNATIDPASPPVATNRSVASLSSSRRDGVGLRRRLVPAPEISSIDSGSGSFVNAQGQRIILSAKATPWFQVSIQRQFQNIVFRKNNYKRGKAANHVRVTNVLPARANLITSFTENVAFSPIQPSSISHAKFFHGEQVIDDVSRFPLVQPVSIQRKGLVTEEQLDSEAAPGYLQRQVTANDDAMNALTASAQMSGINAVQDGKSESNALSIDDVVDKVWRKFMRKLVSERERIGGNRRWPS